MVSARLGVGGGHQRFGWPGEVSQRAEEPLATVAPSGRGPSPSGSRTSSVRSCASRSRGSTATTSTGSRAVRPRPVGARSSGRPRTARATDLTAAAVRRPDAHPRIRRRLRTSSPAAWRCSRTSPTAGSTGSTLGSGRPCRRTLPDRSATATCGSTAPRRRFLVVREEHVPDGQPLAAIVDVPLDGDREPTVLVDGPDFLAAPRIYAPGRGAARLARMG